MRWPAAPISSGVEHELDALSMGGARRLDDLRFAIDLGFKERAFKANLFDTAGSEHRLVVHLVELVFDRGTAAVDYEDFHSF